MDNRSSKPAELSINDPSVEGWKLVPVEPTEEMLDAAYKHYESGDYTGYGSAYVAMLSAAPTPPSAPVQQTDSNQLVEATLKLIAILEKGEWHGEGTMGELDGCDVCIAIHEAKTALAQSPSVELNTKKGG
jgi:hypothetical protein